MWPAERLVRPMVLADHGNIGARPLTALRDTSAGLAASTLSGLRGVNAMVVTRLLYRHMAVRPETEDPGRRIVGTQTKMSEHRNDQ